MTRQETMAVLTILKAAYPNFYKTMSKDELQDIVGLWATMFEADPVDIVTEAVKALMCTLRYPPTIADVKEKVRLIKNPHFLTEMEAWQKVKSAISYYDPVDNFEKLPPILRRIVGSPNTLREWAVMNIDELNTVVQSNFMRTYRAVVEREKEMSMLPESTKQMISSFVVEKLRLPEVTG